MLPNVFDRDLRELRSHCQNGSTINLHERRASEGARELEAGWCLNGNAFHWQREVGSGVRRDLEHGYKASRELVGKEDYRAWRMQRAEAARGMSRREFRTGGSSWSLRMWHCSQGRTCVRRGGVWRRTLIRCTRSNSRTRRSGRIAVAETVGISGWTYLDSCLSPQQAWRRALTDTWRRSARCWARLRLSRPSFVAHTLWVLIPSVAIATGEALYSSYCIPNL